MPLPKSVAKISKKGIEFVSSVDRTKYTMNELSRAALRDVAKLLRKRMATKMKELRGLKRSRRPYKAIQSWVRSKEADLQIGFGNTKKGTSGDAWYAIQQELGTRNQPARRIMRETVFESIDDIRIIEGQYIAAIEDENRALGLIDEREALSDDEEA